MTTDSLTPERLAEMRARCEAASSGPWEEFRGGIRIPGEAMLDWDDPEYLHAGNQEFIAHARTDLPALLDEVERLTRERDEARSFNERARAAERADIVAMIRREADTIEAENEFNASMGLHEAFRVLADLVRGRDEHLKEGT